MLWLYSHILEVAAFLTVASLLGLTAHITKNRSDS